VAFTLRQLQYFVAVAEDGTVSGAAHSLSISQSAVTEAIKELEADLGVKLFERRSRGLSVTRKGRQFLRHAEQILASVADARHTFEEGRGQLAGSLQIGVTAMVAGYVLSDMLARFRRANPAVAVTAIEDTVEYLEHLLIGGELDVAVTAFSGQRERMALHTENLQVSPYRLWLPSGHRLAAHAQIDPRELAREPLILLTIDEIGEASVGMLGALGSRPRIAFRTRSVEAVRSLVATGAGVALLPELLYRPWSLEGDRIEQRAIAGNLPVVNVGIVWRRGSQLSNAAADFVAMAQSAGNSRHRP
jgi:DNA-binding transcriptional LysR family regulator